MTKVVLVETHPLMRLGLHQMLSALPGNWDIVAMDTYAVKEFAYLECSVDLMIFGFPADISQGWEALSQASRILRPERILLLSDPSAPWQQPAGEPVPNIYGCITKTAPIDVLEAAIRLGLAGGECFPNHGPASDVHANPATAGSSARTPGQDATGPIRVSLPAGQNGTEAAASVSAGTAPRGAMDVAEGAQLLNVTPRQYEVLTLLAKGYPIKTVSRMLNISTATAKAHASTLYQRLRVNSKGEAVYAARQRGARFD
jgi:DNA-binding NarL/FixJ family response regulator